MKKLCEIGGILGTRVQTKKGYGFKLSFCTKEEAIKYKEMNEFILKDDEYTIINRTTYYSKGVSK